jgi:hypothetical protein
MAALVVVVPLITARQAVTEIRRQLFHLKVAMAAQVQAPMVLVVAAALLP